MFRLYLILCISMVSVAGMAAPASPAEKDASAMAARLASQKLATDKYDAVGLQLLKYALFMNPDSEEALLLLDSLESDLPIKSVPQPTDAFVAAAETLGKASRPGDPRGMLQYAAMRLADPLNSQARIAQMKAQREGAETDFGRLLDGLCGHAESQERVSDSLIIAYQDIFAENLSHSPRVTEADLEKFRAECVANAKSGAWPSPLAQEGYKIAGRLSGYIKPRTEIQTKMREAETWESKLKTERSEALQREKNATERERRKRNVMLDWNKLINEAGAAEKAAIERLSAAETGKANAPDPLSPLESPVFSRRPPAPEPPVAVTSVSRPIDFTRPSPVRPPPTRVPIPDEPMAATVTVQHPDQPAVYNLANIPEASPIQYQGILREIGVWLRSQSRSSGSSLVTGLVAEMQNGRAILYAEASPQLVAMTKVQRQAFAEGLNRLWASKCQQYGKVWEQQHAHIVLFNGGKPLSQSSETVGTQLVHYNP